MSLSTYFPKLLDALKSTWKKQHYASKIVSLFTIYLTTRYMIIRLHRKYNKMPSGSVGYPLIGSFISVASKGHKYYIDLVRESNDKIMSISMGTTTIICMNEEKLTKYIIDKDCVAWRPKNLYHETIDPSIAFHEGGNEWKKRRKFWQTNLMTMLNKKFVGKNIKILINNCLVPKLNELSGNTDKLWFCHNDLQYITFNISYNCIFGGYIDKNDKLYNQYLINFDAYLHELQLKIFRYFIFGEKIATFIAQKITRNKLDRIYGEQIKIARKWAINAHKKYDKNNINTYYDHVYHELSSSIHSNDKLSYDDIITDKILCDMEVALEGGTDTSAATLEFCITAAAKYPSIQEGIYKEITDNIEDIENFDILSKIHEMHKLRAFVFESLRMLPVVPVVFRGLTNKNHNDGLKINVDGKEYILPNNSVLVINVIGMHYNPKLWKHPDQFDVNRWLNHNGKFKKKQNPEIMGFTWGQRDCPGKPLALKTLYLVIIILFNKYKFYFDEPTKQNINLKLDFVLHVDPHIGCKVMKR